MNKAMAKVSRRLETTSRSPARMTVSASSQRMSRWIAFHDLAVFLVIGRKITCIGNVGALTDPHAVTMCCLVRFY
jgi:hypothetical protein